MRLRASMDCADAQSDGLNMDGSLRSPDPWSARCARRLTDHDEAAETGEFDVIAIDWVSVTADAHFALNLTKICEIGHRIDTLRSHFDRCTADAEITNCPIFTDILTD